MKKLYYTVDKELNEIDRGLYDATGNKTLTAYEIIDNKPKVFCQLDVLLEDDSQEAIIEWADDNGYNDVDFALIPL